MRSSALHSIFAVVCLAGVFVPMRSRADDAPTQAQYGEENAMFSQVDPRTGAMTYSYPFELPSARGLSGPTLALRYNSSMGDGNVAYGWSLGVPTIERRPLSGLPRSTAAGEPIGGERYTFDGQPLVKICQIGGTCPDEPFTSGHPTWASGWSYYRLQNEGLFARFYMSPSRTTFRAVFKGGDMVDFGVPLTDFPTYAGLTPNATLWTEDWDNGITRWLPSIRRSLNHPNNVIVYRWQKLGTRGIAYLTDIWDTPPASGASAALTAYEHHTQLFWSLVTNRGFSHAPPFRAPPDLRLDRVGVASMPWSGGGEREVYRMYSLGYATARGSRPPAGWASAPEIAPLWKHSFLKSISHTGHCTANVEENGVIPEAVQCATLPPVTFDYEPAVPTPFDAYAPTIESGPPDLVTNNGVLPDPANAGIVDFDRDGRPDVVQSWPERCDNGTKFVEFQDVAGSRVLVCVDPSHIDPDEIVRSPRPMLGYRNVGPTIGAPAGRVFGYTCMDTGSISDPFSLWAAQSHGSEPGFFSSQGNTTLGAFGSGLGVWGQNAYLPLVARFVGSAPAGAEPAASGCHLNGSFDPGSFHPSWRWQTVPVEPWQKQVPRDTYENSAPEWTVDLDGDGYPDRLTRHPGPTVGVYARATPTFTRRFAKGEAYPLPPPNGTSTGPALVPFAFSFPPDANSIVPVDPKEVWDPAPNASNRQRVYYTDINGDGLPDAVSRDYLANGGSTMNAIRVRPGDGRGWFECVLTDPQPCTEEAHGYTFFSSFYELDIVAPFKPWETLPGVTPAGSQGFFEMADITGDGLSDIVRTVKDGFRTRVDVWVNIDGHRFECVGAPTDPCLAGYFNVDVTSPYPNHRPRLTFADMDSDGVNDIVFLTQKGAFVGKFNATPVQGPSGERAVRPGQLIRISNGRGARTEVKYQTVQELEKAAADAGSPWLHRSPVVESVVTEMRTHNQDPGSPAKPAPFGIDRYVRFTYREPGYDNWARRFVGFRKVGVRQGHDPAITETTYWLGPCENGDTPAENAPALCPSTSDDEDPSFPSYRSWVGKPMRVDRYVPEGPNQTPARYLWSRTFEYDPPAVLFGPDVAHPEIDRHVTFAYAKRVDTHLYFTDQPTSAGYSFSTLPGGDDIELAPAQTGHRILASTVRMDSNGTIVEQANLGEEAADLALVTQLTNNSFGAAPEVTCDANWNCLPSYKFVFSHAGGGASQTVHRQTRLIYDSEANLRKVEAELDSTQSLTRYHPGGPGAYSENAPGAAAAGWKTQGEFDYDANGGLLLAKGPGDASTPHRSCARSTLDPEFGHFPKVVKVFTDTCDTGPALETVLSFDRDFGVPVTATAPDLGVSMLALDPFGRVEAAFAPEPDGLVGATRVAGDATYSDFGPAPFVESRIYTSGVTYIRSVQILDALAEPVMQFQQGDGSEWMVGAWTQRDASGRVVLTRRPFGVSAGALATAQGAGSVGTPAYGAFEPMFDAFGRVVGTKENGVQILERKPNPLTVEIRDQEQLPGGGHVGAFTIVEVNGRGEVHHVAQHANGGVVDTYNFLDGVGQPYVIFKTGPGAPDYARSMVWDSFGRMVENSEPNTTDRATGRTIRYAYDDANRLAGTSDGRGCGVDYYYDALGRSIGEDYSPCVASQREFSQYVPGGPTSKLEVEFRYDAYDPAQVNPEPGFGDDPGLAAGRLTALIDRGAETHFNYDARARTRRVSRRVAKPLSQQAPGTDPYAAHWFRSRTDYDVADRVTMRTTGADGPEFIAGGVDAEHYTYSSRGMLQGVSSGVRSIIDSISYRPDGLLSNVTYGDLAHTQAQLTYDAERVRLQTYTVSRGAPVGGLWTAPSTPNYPQPGPETTQTVLALFSYHYDLVGNPDKINDTTPASGLDEHVLPMWNRDTEYDDFYRVQNVKYGYGSVNAFATYRPAFKPEIDAGDTRPAARKNLPTRPHEQHFGYDFMGNTTSTTDDLSASYDRSLGAVVTNGDASGWGPNQLVAADGINARYDEAGNLVELKVERSGNCPSGIGSRCAQWYAYEWDEVGQLSRARRWDYPTTLPSPAGEVPDEDPTWDLHYEYSGGIRVLKSAKDAVGTERHTLEVFGSLRFDRDEYIPAAEDYERHRFTTHVYLAGGVAHAFYDDALPSPPNTDPTRIYLNVGDHLGSTTAVIDHTTSELVERSTFMAYGALESDYRPDRWAHPREPYKFTGKEEDIEVGATYFGARYYNAHLGRFMSPDPLTIHGLASDMNPYAYVSGRVMSHIDPLGLQAASGQGDPKASAAATAAEVAQLAAMTPPPGIPGAGGTITGTKVFAGPQNPFADVHLGSGIGGPLMSPDAVGISGLERLERNGSPSQGPSNNAWRSGLAIPEGLADQMGTDGQLDPDAKRGTELAGWAFATFIAVRTGVAAYFALDALIDAALIRLAFQQAVRQSAGELTGRAAIAHFFTQVIATARAAARPNADCRELSQKTVPQIPGGQLITIVSKTGQVLKYLPKEFTHPSKEHQAVLAPNGSVVDTFVGATYASVEAWVAATLAPGGPAYNIMNSNGQIIK